MCGIVLLQTTSRTLTQDSIERVRAALASIKHRGPDGHGVVTESDFVLGHCRLAVIDQDHDQLLSHGPFRDHQNQLLLSFNGEIYNYRELRTQLIQLGQHFHTNSDTEVVCKAWAQWGAKSLNKFRGMFAFVMADLKHKQIILARDPLGIKPLYFAQSRGEIIVASELRAFKPFITPSLNHDQLAEFLMFGHVAAPETLLEGINQIPPGVWGKIDCEGQLSWHHYLEEKTNSSSVISQEEFEHDLKESIEMHTVSDVGHSLLLSGGIDSSIIAATLPSPLRTFSISVQHEKSDESEYQKIVTDQFACQSTFHQFGPTELAKALPSATISMDAPVFHLGSIALHLLYQHVAQDSKVTLTGEGADELFGGYDRYLLNWPQLLSKQLKLAQTESKIEKLEILYPHLRRLYLSPKRLHSFIPDLKFSSLERSTRLNTMFDKNNLVTRESLYQHDQHSHLEALLTRQDRMSSHASVECRVPFCDPFLWQKYASTPLESKLGQWGGKTPLKECLRKVMGHEFIVRKKKGLGMPIGEWLTQKPLSQYLEILQDQTAKSRGLYDCDYITFEIKRLYAKDYASSQYLMRLILLELWLRQISVSK